MKIRSSRIVLCAFVGFQLAISLANAESFESGGWQLKYTEEGSGPAMVAVHGAVSDHRTWSAYERRFAEKYRFIAYDRRFYGHGEWPKNLTPYNHSEHAEDLATLIRKLDLGPTHVVAISSGAYAAVIVAAKYPELVASLSLWEPFVGDDLPSSVDLDEETLSKMKDWGASWGPVFEEFQGGNFEQTVETFIEVVYEMEVGSFSSLSEAKQKIFHENAKTLPVLFSQNANTTDKVTCDFLSRIKSPTLVLRGSDTHSGYSIRHSLVRDCIPEAKEAIIADVTHNGATLKPLEVSLQVLKFLHNL